MANQSKRRAARKQRRLRKRREQQRTGLYRRRLRRAANDLKRQVRKLAQKADGLSFYSLLTSPQFLERLEELLPEHRERKYPPTVTLAMFLGQVLSADPSLQKAVDEAIVNRLLKREEPGSANTGPYSDARARLPQELVEELARDIAKMMRQLTPAGWLWRGRHVNLVDGTTTQMPDTPENQEKYPQHEQQKSGAGYPIARLVGVISLADGAVIDVAMGPYKGKGTGEHGLFRELLKCFAKGDVMIADSYYCSYWLNATLMAMGVDFVFEQHGARDTDFRTGAKLGVRDHLATWKRPARPEWMTSEEYAQFPLELTVREARVGKKILVTSFLNPREVCKRELDKLFRLRWNVELDLRNIKTTLGMEELRCRTPSMCEKEVAVYMLAYNLVRLLMAQAAVQADVLPRQLSFKHTVQIWLAWSQKQFHTETPEDLATLFQLISHIRVGNRPGRVEPRAIKRRPKAFPRLQSTRRVARRNIKLYGHPKKLAA